MKFLAHIFIVFAIYGITSCSSKYKEQSKMDRPSVVETRPASIKEVRLPAFEMPEDAKVSEFIVTLENHELVRTDQDSADLLDPNTGTIYRVHDFTMALGVRSRNEERYLLKLYHDHSLFGISPIYPDLNPKN